MRRRRAPWALALIALVSLGGCVGYIGHRFDWEVAGPVEVKTRAEVLARLGEPHRRTQEDGREVWYYFLSERGPFGQRPLQETWSVTWALIVPIPWRTRPAENVRIVLVGDAVAEATRLVATERGFYCGVNLAHGNLFLCERLPSSPVQ